MFVDIRGQVMLKNDDAKMPDIARTLQHDS